MGVTAAMNTGATGLISNSIMLETIGNNIANINTTAFKSNRADFESQLSITLRDGAGPANGLGGVNPAQIGLGSQVAAIQRNQIQGAISPTGQRSDLAIDGSGFFIVNNGTDQLYTRDGSFALDVDGRLVTKDGFSVQGYTADSAGVVDPAGALGELIIPLGTLTQAAATTSVIMNGNLNADAVLAVEGALQTSEPVATGLGGIANGATALVDLADSSGNGVLAAGDTIRVQGVQKGEGELTSAEFVVGTDGTTVADFMTFLEGVLGIHTDPALEEEAGVTLTADGRLQIRSNLGEANAITADTADIINATTGEALFTFASPPVAAAGEGPTTGFVIYDSLGSEVNVRLRLALVAQGEQSSTWRYYAESSDDTDVSKVLGSGTITFDQDGRFVSAESAPLTIDLAGSGAAEPLTFTVDFSTLTGLATQPGGSELKLDSQDGLPFGTLVDYAIDEDGFIEGTFSNAVRRTLGQVPLATFINPAGLRLERDNNYVLTDNSGLPVIAPANTGSAGRIESGALEQSNVDLAREFIGLINASTGFSANGRVITTADEMMQELLLIAR